MKLWRVGRVGKWRPPQLVVVALVLALPLTATPAWSWESSELQLAPEFYQQSLQSYSQSSQWQSQSARSYQDHQGSSTFNWGVNLNAGDMAQQTNGALQGFLAPRRNWERNNVDDLKLNFGAYEDWVQVSVRQARSDYAADPDYLRMLALRNHNPLLPGKERFLNNQGAEGTAGLARLEMKVFESDLIGLSGFAYRSEVDQNFISVTANKAKDEFALANRSTDGAGTKMRFGSISLTSTYTSSTPLVGVGSFSETKQDYKLGFDTSDFRQRLGDTLFSPMLALAPTSIYAGTYSKENSYQATSAPPDRTTGLSAGAVWAWSGGSFNVDYWNYALDSRRTGDASYDMAGRGYDANLGFFGRLVSFNIGVSYSQSDYLAPLAKAVDRSYDAYSSVAYKPMGLPDLVLQANFGRYGYDSIAYNAVSDAAYRSATLAFDFSKFLWKPYQQGTYKNPLAASPNLKLFYRYHSETDHGITGGMPGDSHLFGMAFRTGLN
jgi:hypothetical protein